MGASYVFHLCILEFCWSLVPEACQVKISWASWALWVSARLLRRSVTQSGRTAHFPSHKWMVLLGFGFGGVSFCFVLWMFLVCHISQFYLIPFEIIRFCKMTPFNSLPAFPSDSEGINWTNVLTSDTCNYFPPSPPFLVSLLPQQRNCF